MSAPLEPINSELVAVAWVLSLPGILPGQAATTTPPRDRWPENRFITVDAVVGGSPHPDAPIRRPVVQLSAWAFNPGSDTHPPWSKAWGLIERIVRCTETDSEHRSKVVAPRAKFEQATVQDVTVISEPGRFPTADPASYARIRVDLQMIWTRLTNPEVHT